MSVRSFLTASLGTAALGTVLLAPTLADFAVKFGPPEYFALMVMGLTVVAYLARKSMAKALMMAVVGILLGCIGLDPITATPRFTFGMLELADGIGIAPVGAYLAVSGAWSQPAAGLLVIALGVMCWVAGFDILYAMQDRDFDRAQGLHSIPAALGAEGAVWTSRVLHIVSILALAVVGPVAGGGALYAAGVGVAAILLLYEHSLVSATDLSRLNAAFFTMNGVISIAFFLFVLAERLVRHWVHAIEIVRP